MCGIQYRHRIGTLRGSPLPPQLGQRGNPSKLGRKVKENEGERTMAEVVPVLYLRAR